jgi:hypothetical protein
VRAPDLDDRADERVSSRRRSSSRARTKRPRLQTRSGVSRSPTSRLLIIVWSQVGQRSRWPRRPPTCRRVRPAERDLSFHSA